MNIQDFQIIPHVNLIFQSFIGFLSMFSVLFSIPSEHVFAILARASQNGNLLFEVTFIY